MGSAPYCTNVESGCLTYTIQKIEYPETGGTYTHMIGFKYPFEGYPDHITLGLNATVKRAVISTLKLFFNSFKKKPTENLVNWLAEIYEAEYEKYQNAEKRLCRTAKEVLRVLLKFAKNDRQKKAAWCIAMFVEMDSAYRYRLQDVLSEFNKTNPIRKEVLRLIDLGLSREVCGIGWKWKMLRLAIGVALLIPSIKRTIRKMAEELVLDNITPNTSDIYYMSRYFDYNFQGLDYDVREAWKKQEDSTYIPPKIEAPEYANVSVKPNKFFYELSREDAEKMVDKVKGRLMEDYDKNGKI